MTIIVNVQGDEPEIEPEIDRRLIERAGMRPTTTWRPRPRHFRPALMSTDPNLVKVVDGSGRAGRFISRGRRSRFTATRLRRRQRRVLFTSGDLRVPAAIPAAVRLLAADARWSGPKSWSNCVPWSTARSIYVLKVNRATHGIDTPEQYEEFVERFRQRAKLSDRPSLMFVGANLVLRPSWLVRKCRKGEHEVRP